MILTLIVSIWIGLLSSLKAEGVPEFKGGTRNLSSFITNNLIYPEYAKQNCLQGTIQISFRLTKSGKIFQSNIQKGFGVDLDLEALRVIRLTSGRWNVPASFDTTQSIVIPVNFILKEYDCNQRSAEDIQVAIAAFKARQDLTQAVINFYAKKESGAYSSDDELTISNLKQQLGYDEKYFDRMVKQGQQKLKQGDKQGACEDFNMVKNLGSDKASKLLSQNCN